VVSNSNTYLARFSKELLETLQGMGHEVVVLCPTDDYMQSAWTVGVERIELPLVQHGLNPWSELRTLWALFRAFRRLKPDLTINFTIKPAIYGSIAATLAGVRRTASVFTGLGYWFTEGTQAPNPLKTAIQLALRLALKRNEIVFFLNDDDRRLFIDERLARGAQTRVVDGSGVDTAFFAPRQGRVQPNTFLLIGRMMREKGVYEFVAAARELRQRRPSSRFWLLGPIDTSRSAIDELLIREWTSEGVVEYFGEVADVRDFIARASVVVLPSYREGTPRSVLEAMSMAKPIVTTDTPGCRETVREGVNGFLVPPRDVPGLVRTLERFLNNASLVERMGRESRRLAVERYDVHKVNSAFLAELGLLPDAEPRNLERSLLC